MTTRAGYVAIVGRPNVGKSTLLNALLGQKLSITAPRPQTTRHNILGIYTEHETQIVFVDTPGMHRNKGKALNRFLNRQARLALDDVQACLHVIEAGKWTEEDDLVVRSFELHVTPVILIVNKIDRLKNKERLLPFLQSAAAHYPYADVVPVSSTRKDGLDRVLRTLDGHLPESEFIFDENQVSDRGGRFFAAELIREKLVRRLGQELPYATTVMIDSMEQGERGINIAATIFVEREGQKAIVIGKGGECLKAIGTSARHELSRFFEHPVHLQLWVKQKGNWSDDEARLREFGYTDFSQ